MFSLKRFVSQDNEACVEQNIERKRETEKEREGKGQNDDAEYSRSMALPAREAHALSPERRANNDRSPRSFPVEPTRFLASSTRPPFAGTSGRPAITMVQRVVNRGRASGTRKR